MRLPKHLQQAKSVAGRRFGVTLWGIWQFGISLRHEIEMIHRRFRRLGFASELAPAKLWRAGECVRAPPRRVRQPGKQGEADENDSDDDQTQAARCRL